ncbi:LysE family translocator [Streptomyces avicenniae]|uniref:LysE family translocator n=1 Tax=Streptomyces avicenniae TaxID=500153 RepID=UPI000699555F|nr:LysE family translocator [Streptomyces avicenniae]
MIHPYAVAGFLLAVLPLVATPGASLTLLVRHVGDGGGRRALPVVLGTVAGLYVHAALAIAGLSALVTASSEAFTAVRLAGAAYLVGLGIWTWRSAGGATDRRAGHRWRRPCRSVHAQALLANVLNPKAASIYLTLVPQFVAPHEPFAGQILVLATAHALLIALWLLVWAWLVHRASRVVRGARFRRVTARVSGLVLTGLGIRTATA